MQRANYTILSVGGSVIIPPSGFDVAFLKKLRAILLSAVARGQKFILVVGGGATCRVYQEAARKFANITAEDLDWVGIKTTHANAELVRVLLKSAAHRAVIINPTKKIKTSKPIIVAAGWQPGCSTDRDAVLLAKTYGAKEVINVSNIDFVYDRDPNKYKDAVALPRLSWAELKKIVGAKWRPGANVPFDPKAVSLAARLGLTVRFVKGFNLAGLQSALSGQASPGTVIEG